MDAPSQLCSQALQPYLPWWLLASWPLLRRFSSPLPSSFTVQNQPRSKNDLGHAAATTATAVQQCTALVCRINTGTGPEQITNQLVHGNRVWKHRLSTSTRNWMGLRFQRSPGSYAAAARQTRRLTIAHTARAKLGLIELTRNELRRGSENDVQQSYVEATAFCIETAVYAVGITTFTHVLCENCPALCAVRTGRSHP